MSQEQGVTARPGRLYNRIAIVTGASSGIGRAIALRYAKESATVVVADVKQSSAAAEEQDATTVDLIQQRHGNAAAVFILCDVTKRDSVDGLISKTVEAYGRLDIMVNNAGIAPEANAPSPIWEASDEMLDATLSVNLKGVFYGVRAAARQMVAQEPLKDVAYGARGWIVNIASIYGIIAAPASSAYVTSKHAVVGLTKAAALDCAERRVHVNAVCPGWVQSNFIRNLADRTPDQLAAIGRDHVFKGLGVPEDVAGVALFLATDDSQWMTGSCVEVDGAFSKH